MTGLPPPAFCRQIGVACAFSPRTRSAPTNLTTPTADPDGSHPFLVPGLVRRLLEDRTVLFGALSSDGTVTWIAPSCENLVGRQPAELVGRSALELVHPEDRILLAETLAESARGAEERIRVAVRIGHADGHWITLEFGGIDLRDADGNGTFLVWGSPNESSGRLLQFMRSLLAGDDQARLLDEVVRWHDSTSPDTHSVVLVREPDGTYRCRARSHHLPDRLAFDVVDDRAAAGPIGPLVQALRSRATVEWLDLDEDDSALPHGPAADGYRAVWAVPVIVPGDDHPEALFVVWRLRPGPSLATHRRQLEHTTQVVRLAIEWSIAQRELVTAATTDPLTGLANRAQLQSRIRSDRSDLAAVLFVDLDDFKRVNDVHGHLVGDRILRETARRMADAVRPTDLLVRLGGDEFAVWCPELHTPLDAERVADRLIKLLDEPVEIEGEAYRLGCSIGVAVSAVDDSRFGDPDRLLGAADEALYRAKRAGKGRWASAHEADQQLPFPTPG